ncbi:hypothetical protein K439DRAFT_1263259, partial [Ramaria rubella]
EALDCHLDIMWDFIDALEHQQQFRDPCFLSQFEQRRASFFHFVEQCQDLERCTNSTRSRRPNTWEGNGNTMFYRTRP